MLKSENDGATSRVKGEKNNFIYLLYINLHEPWEIDCT